MNKLIKVTTPILIFILMLATLFKGLQNTLSSPTKTSAKSAIDLFMTSAHIKNFRLDGTLASRLKSSEITHQPLLKKTFFQQPHMILYSKKQSPWTIIADHGSRQDNRRITHLWGNVVLTQKHQSPPYITTIKTQDLLYYPKQNQAISTNLTHYSRNQLHIKGIGVKVNFNTNQVRIQRQSFFHFTPKKTPRNTQHPLKSY